jgi:D-alanyl-D-alanine dipeptidase
MAQPSQHHEHAHDADAFVAAVASACELRGLRLTPLRLRVLDAARPQRVQELFWAHVKGTPMQAYFAPPERGSIHSFGMAVDLTLADAQGAELDMGTPFDDTTERSHPALEHVHEAAGLLTPVQLQHRRLLRSAMLHAGWQAIATEWWHFDFGERDEVRRFFRRIV